MHKLSVYLNSVELKRHVAYFGAVWVPSTLNHTPLTHTFPKENTKTD